MKYECSKCGATGCKLWRQYNTFLNHLELKCAKCSGADISTLDADGRVESSLHKRGGEVHILATGKIGHFGVDVPMPRTDQLGSLVPAVPTDDGESFWGYTSVPDAGCSWWRALPSLPTQSL